MKFQVSRSKSGELSAVNVQRRYSGRVKLIKDSFGFVLYKVNFQPVLLVRLSII